MAKVDYAEVANLRDRLDATMVTMDEAVVLLRQCGMAEQEASYVMKNFRFKASSICEYLWEGGNEHSLIVEATRAPLEKIFSEADIDKSGDACFTELVDALRRYTALAAHFGFPQLFPNAHDLDAVERFFKEADVDKDSRLSWDEFFNHMVYLIKSSTNALNIKKPKTDICLKGAANATVDAPILSWQMDHFALSEADELQMVLQGLAHWDCVGIAGAPIDLTTFGLFFAALKAEYLDNPYHNFQHALSTVHYSFKLVQTAGLTARIGEADRLALIVAALCHDVGHRGYNTVFEVNTRSWLALRYNDKSPLENHHIAKSFELALASPDDKCNIFAGWDNESYTNVRKRMVSAILATDMAFHNDHVKTLKAMTEMTDDVGVLLDTFLHCADISNPVMPPDMSVAWSARVQAEFTAQVAAERSLGIPISVFFDGLDDPIKAAKVQVGFIDFLVSPLYSPVFSLCPELSEAQDNLNKNREYWAALTK